MSYIQLLPVILLAACTQIVPHGPAPIASTPMPTNIDEPASTQPPQMQVTKKIVRGLADVPTEIRGYFDSSVLRTLDISRVAQGTTHSEDFYFTPTGKLSRYERGSLPSGGTTLSSDTSLKYDVSERLLSAVIDGKPVAINADEAINLDAEVRKTLDDYRPLLDDPRDEFEHAPFYRE